MPDHKISPDVLRTLAREPRTPDLSPRHSVAARLVARMRAGEYDRRLSVGVAAEPGSALSAHRTRITSTRERHAVARALRDAVHNARDRSAPMSSRIPLNIPNIVAAEPIIDRVTLRLHAPSPVSVRGMSRLRLVLSDGSGPLYRYGRGDLGGRLGAALAEL